MLVKPKISANMLVRNIDAAPSQSRTRRGANQCGLSVISLDREIGNFDCRLDRCCVSGEVVAGVKWSTRASLRRSCCATAVQPRARSRSWSRTFWCFVNPASRAYSCATRTHSSSVAMLTALPPDARPLTRKGAVAEMQRCLPNVTSSVPILHSVAEPRHRVGRE
jgi:hypothetical protein